MARDALDSFATHASVVHGVTDVNQKSVNILFYVCSHRGDIRQKQKAKTYY